MSIRIDIARALFILLARGLTTEQANKIAQLRQDYLNGKWGSNT